MATDSSFKYSCFVSYRQGQKRLMIKFIKQLLKALESYIEPYVSLPVYYAPRDLEGGDLYNPAFAEALNHSVCMICVYTPTYFDEKKTFCAREYRGMEIIEEHRFSIINNNEIKNRGLIIPIIFKGKPPTYISKKRTCKYDFSKYTLCSDNIIHHKDYSLWFDEIGRQIHAIYDGLINENKNYFLNSFSLPSEEDIKPMLIEIIPKIQAKFPEITSSKL